MKIPLIATLMVLLIALGYFLGLRDGFGKGWDGHKTFDQQYQTQHN